MRKKLAAAVMVPALVTALFGNDLGLHGGYGDFMSPIRFHGRTPVRFKMCPVCGAEHKTLYLNDKQYVCSKCIGGTL